MTLMLGIYSKKKLDKSKLKSIIKEFSLDGKRHLYTEHHGSIILSVLKSPNSGIAKNSEETLTAAFSGRLYNLSKDLKVLSGKGHKFKSNSNLAEFILHAYEEYGVSFFNKLRGQFSFCIYDKNSNEVTLVNDQFGIYPLFSYEDENIVIFSNEYEPITKYESFSYVKDYDAIAEYFSFGYPLGNKTFFKRITNLDPGSILKINSSSSKLSRYYNPKIKQQKGKDIAYFAEKIARIMKDSVQIRLNQNKITRCELSGGADTRLILSCMTKEQRKKITFFTKGRDYIQDNENRDILISKLISKKLSLRHKIYTEKTMEFGRIFFDELRIKHVPLETTISGTYGGEFLGADCFNACPEKIQDIKSESIEKKLKVIISKKMFRKISDPNITLNNELKKIKSDNKEFLFMINRFTRSFFTSIYPKSRNRWMVPYTYPTVIDSPFTDSELLKALLEVPEEFLKGYNLYNEIYKIHFPELIGIPTNSPLGLKSRSCMNLMKKGKEPKSMDLSKDKYSLSLYKENKIYLKEEIYNKKFIESLKKGKDIYDFLWNYIKFKESNSNIFLNVMLYLKNKNIPGQKHLLNYTRSKERNNYEVASFIGFDTWRRKFFGE